MTIAIAHRGDPVAHPENTLAAFHAALAQGADMIELDCRRTKDGVIIVLHDPDLERVWGVRRRAADLRAEDVAALTCSGERIPTLAEVLAQIALPVMVDVADPGIIADVFAQVEASGATERCLFAGHLRALEWLRATRKDVRIALSWGRIRRPSRALLDALRPEYFNPRYHFVDDKVIAAMHGLGIGVSTWTVDDERRMRELAAAGVDAIISNRVGTLVPVLRAGAARAERTEEESRGR